MFLFSSLLLLQALHVFANTEKAIFLGPSNIQVPVAHPNLEDLQLGSLSPKHWSLRTYIQAEFPNNVSEYGQISWYLLDKLQEGQRYEVRICWAATQPTSFRLDAFELSTVFESPDLINSLAQFSKNRRKGVTEELQPQESPMEKQSTRLDGLSSILLLRIYAAADYYTMNKTLMEQVPPVYVDIILDPFIFNLFPRSLVPTAAYIILVALGSWYLAKQISLWVSTLSANERGKKNV
ncbi:uncharacterized protein RAG0_00290 [Rhynchosporium agropyri]|uniref:GPI-Mannosyltransferase II co-activator n=1 Tax=Rhynchosporium agropyri TaxID=914238 RepID=A0A1E1JRY4_9HELO|nr:uncharacterized protein RAG0_00290 [Rhynchosporium agropyri]